MSSRERGSIRIGAIEQTSRTTAVALLGATLEAADDFQQVAGLGAIKVNPVIEGRA